MSTSWYAIDLDGNVAIIEFNENGPVPVFVPESTEDDVIYNQFSFKEDKIVGRWPYSSEEVDSMLQDARDVVQDRDGYLLFTTVVKVDMTRYDEFLAIARLMASDDDSNTVCIDRENGLFYLDWCGDSSEIDEMADAAVESGLITPLRTFDIYQDSDSSVDVLRCYPFFVYRQDYDSLVPLRRTVAPEKPFTEDRLPLKARDAAIRVPVRFKDAPFIQIAKYALCEVYGCETTFIERRAYSVYKQEDDSLIYVADSSIITEWCGKTCKKCCPHGILGESSYAFQRIKEPTILVIKDLMEIPYLIRKSSDNYLIHSVFIPFLSGITCSYYTRVNDDGQPCRNLLLEQWFEKCRMNLEENIRFFHPYAVLIYQEVLPFIEKYYMIEDGMVCVGEHRYPFFIWEERDQHMAEIERLAGLPYRGGQIRWVIPLTAEEIQEFAKYSYL